MRNHRSALLFIAPAGVLLLVLAVYPLLRALTLSIFKTDYGFAGATFVGLENYVDLLSDRFFNRAMLNTVMFTLTATAGEVGLGLILALAAFGISPADVWPFPCCSRPTSWPPWSSQPSGAPGAIMISDS